MEEDANGLERGYRKLNSITVLSISLEDWMSVLIPLISLIVPDLSGLPPQYATPVILFVLETAWILARSREHIWRKVALTAVACSVLCAVLVFSAARTAG
jgi:hypothetical protein